MPNHTCYVPGCTNRYNQMKEKNIKYYKIPQEPTLATFVAHVLLLSLLTLVSVNILKEIKTTLYPLFFHEKSHQPKRNVVSILWRGYLLHMTLWRYLGEKVNHLTLCWRKEANLSGTPVSERKLRPVDEMFLCLMRLCFGLQISFLLTSHQRQLLVYSPWVIKHIFKNVKGCRDGSKKKHTS